jgi:NAD(P)-dependent dehydrogenase (short-subunit alcohol dehydrogenase family)
VTTRPLSGQLAVVTGGSKGIGAAVSAMLLADGAIVVRAGRSLESGSSPHEVRVAVDLTTDEGLAHLAAEVDRHGVPDLVVSNAGGFTMGPIEQVPVDRLDQLYRINLRAPYEVARRFLPAMRARGHGRHILIGSIADQVALTGNAAYTATKFGARGLHLVLREEYRGSGVLCSLISPGAVDTELWDPFEPDQNPGLPPRAKMLQPDDVAAAVRWVAHRPRTVDVESIRLSSL